MKAAIMPLRVAARSLCNQRRWITLHAGRGREPGADFFAELARIDQVAVVPECDRARGAMVEQRLSVCPCVRTCCRVTRVADCELAAQAGEVLLVEHLCDEPEIA